MKKVIYVLNSTYLLGGASKSFLLLLNGIAQCGMHPIVIVPDRNGLYSVLVQMGIEVIDITYRNNTYPHYNSLKDILLFLPRLFARRLVNWNAVRKLYAQFSNSEISLVHTNVSVIDIGFRLAQRLHVPHVYHIREYGDLDFHEIYYPTSVAFHAMWCKSSYSICITKHIQSHHGLTGDSKSVVIYNGIDVPPVDIDSLLKEDYFLFAGRIDESKGVHVLLEAYANYLQHSSLQRRLVIAGDPDKMAYLKKLQRFIKEYQIENKVKFLGGRKDIYELMQHAIAIVIPSRFEGFGRCMAEAMMNGCLVVAHNTAGLKEQFDNGVLVTGREIGLRYMTTSELSERLIQIDSMTNKDMKQYMADAYQTAYSLYTSQINVQSVYRFYNQIIAKG